MNLEDILAGWNGCSGSGGGGGSTEALIFNMVGEYPNAHSSVTFGEIYNAIMNGKSVIMRYPDYQHLEIEDAGTYNMMDSMTIYYTDNGGDNIEYMPTLYFYGTSLQTDSAPSLEGLFPKYLYYAD